MSEKPHILMIDDDPMIQRLFGAKLAAAGYELIYANDTEAGREMARRFNPELILLDIRMPGEGGYKLAKRLKEEGPTKNIPVIFLTNEDMETEGEKWVKKGWVTDFFHKSIDLKEMVERINKIVPSSGAADFIKKPKAGLAGK